MALVSSRLKFAQEDIADWKKAEAEVAIRKQELGEELQQKIADRVSFYAELKDRILKLSYAREEQDKRVHESMMKVSKELEKKYEKLEEKYLEKNKMVAVLRRENSQLTNSLHVKDELIHDASEKMSQATKEFNILMAKKDSTEKENAFLRYQLQMLQKELDNRNEEAELNRRSADALEKKYSESTYRIRRLEAECQSLRVLTRKRHPGPTASAKMKTEVKAQRRVPRGVPDRRIRLMIERACDVEEENKILKENADKKDEELSSLRNAFTLLNSKLSQLEDQLVDRPESQVQVKKCDCFKSRDLSTEKPSDWLQNVVEVILEQTHNSKRNINEILEDIWASLKLSADHLETTKENEASKLENMQELHDSELAKLQLDLENLQELHDSELAKLQLDLENLRELHDSELAKLQLDLENLQVMKRLVENQLENQKMINEELDTQLTVSKVQLNELLQNLSSLEVKLQDKSHYCEELEETCLELHVQLESVCSKVVEEKEKHDEEFFQTDEKIPDDSKKIVVCQETILNLGEQLKALTSSKESPPKFDRVLSKSGDKTSTLHASLRDRILAEEGVNFVVDDDPNSPQTKEIILHSSSGGPSFHEVVRSNVPGAVTIVTNNKKRGGGGMSLLKRLLARRKKGVNKKKSSSLVRGRSL